MRSSIARLEIRHQRQVRRRADVPGRAGLAEAPGPRKAYKAVERDGRVCRRCSVGSAAAPPLPDRSNPAQTKVQISSSKPQMQLAAAWRATSTPAISAFHAGSIEADMLPATPTTAIRVTDSTAARLPGRRRSRRRVRRPSPGRAEHDLLALHRFRRSISTQTPQGKFSPPPTVPGCRSTTPTQRSWSGASSGGLTNPSFVSARPRRARPARAEVDHASTTCRTPPSGTAAGGSRPAGQRLDHRPRGAGDQQRPRPSPASTPKTRRSPKAWRIAGPSARPRASDADNARAAAAAQVAQAHRQGQHHHGVAGSGRGRNGVPGAQRRLRQRSRARDRRRRPAVRTTRPLQEAARSLRLSLREAASATKTMSSVWPSTADAWRLGTLAIADDLVRRHRISTRSPRRQL